MDVEKYTHGRCHIFALVAADVLGYEIKSLWDEEPFDEDLDDDFIAPPALVHMWVENSKGRKFDCSGFFTDRYLEDEFEAANEPYLSSDTTKSVNKMISDGILSKPQKGEIDSLRKFIVSNQRRFK